MKADFIFINGEVITVNAKNTITEAVAIKGNKIIAVGTNEEIKQWSSSATNVIDLQGKSLLPGFIESHAHITMYGTNQLAVSCKDPENNSISKILTALKEKAEAAPKGEWVRAWGFNNETIAEKRYPTLEELDSVSSDHPIIITRTCGHISAVNSYALKIFNIDENTPDPEGGKIGRAEHGTPNGLLIESAHMNTLGLASYSEKEFDQAHEIASKHFLEKGITSIHDAGGVSAANMRSLQSAVKKDLLKQRVYVIYCALNESVPYAKDVLKTGIVTGLGDEKYKIGPVKVFLDGSSTGPTIATRKPYTSDQENYGIKYLSQEELDELFLEAHKMGWQITAHAQGDAAIEMLLNTYEKANKLHPRKDHRHRIEHADVAMPDLIERMKELEVIPIPNPAFLYEFGDIYLHHYGERVNHMYPLNDYLQNGIKAAIGSDSPVTDFSPMRGLYEAVHRKSQSNQDAGIHQRVPILEAIRMYTINGAYASFEEDFKGSIEPGKVADLIVLDRSILNTERKEILDIEVLMTMIDGKRVYETEQLSELVSGGIYN
ncbi:putative amidohydrolase YtcJ [Bacillus pakistanensis]|uniref:Amidohydrolase YtcJ n=1 Tax=Rossellomorea pakistanensis TaxID=992288 RepID=A0ABS2NHR7_9BACI|nr:amidohydrolase [Bacillus pakistanensis]MBM7587406.1 putative amidohydrolase YtcJ [Bacillus pakistanensis]